MLVWTDLETTGLEPENCSILEIAAIITDDDLNEVARFQRVVYWESAAYILDWVDRGHELSRLVVYDGPNGGKTVDPYVVDMHIKNGLWRDVVHGQALDTVDRDFAAFIQEHAVKTVEYVDEKTGETKTREDKPQLAGSTISFDRGFIGLHMKRSVAKLNHRNIDVSTFNETGRRYWKDVYEARPRSGDKAHRGMADIQESLNVYKHYLACLTAVAPPPANANQFVLPIEVAA
jgi:oligoribonuclease